MHGQALTMGNLPEDPPIVDGLKTVQIKKGDYRKGLVPKQVNCEPNCLEPCIDPCMFVLRLFGQHTSGPYALHLKHLPNVETRFFCPQAFLSLDFQSWDDVSELK